MTLTRCQLFYLFIVSSALYTTVALLRPNTEVLVAVRAFQVTTSIAVVWRFRWAFKAVLKHRGAVDDWTIFSLAILLGYAGQGLNAFWLLIWRSARLGTIESAWMGPNWMVDAAINGYWVLVSGWSALLYMSAPGTENGKLTDRNLRLVAQVMIWTLILASIGLTQSFWFIKASLFLEPYMAEWRLLH